MESITEQKPATLKPKQVLIIGANTYNEKTLKEFLKKKSESKRETIKNTLTESFSYNVKVENNDSVKVNNTTINTNGKQTDHIKVVVNSEVLNKRLSEKYGIDFQKLYMENKGDFESLTLSNLFKKIGKTE